MVQPWQYNAFDRLDIYKHTKIFRKKNLFFLEFYFARDLLDFYHLFVYNEDGIDLHMMLYMMYLGKQL
jgi:hypothetical protein